MIYCIRWVVGEGDKVTHGLLLHLGTRFMERRFLN